jgi:iron complex transport system substrate-binding protein
MRQLNAEGILALKPTLVIASAQAKPSLVLQQIAGQRRAQTGAVARHQLRLGIQRIDNLGDVTANRYPGAGHPAAGCRLHAPAQCRRDSGA